MLSGRAAATMIHLGQRVAETLVFALVAPLTRGCGFAHCKNYLPLLMFGQHVFATERAGYADRECAGEP